MWCLTAHQHKKAISAWDNTVGKRVSVVYQYKILSLRNVWCIVLNWSRRQAGHIFIDEIAVKKIVTRSSHKAVFMSSVHIGGVFFCQTVDGVDVRQPNVSWLRSQLGLVSQEPVLVDYSICENIEYGDNGRHMTMDEVMGVSICICSFYALCFLCVSSHVLLFISSCALMSVGAAIGLHISLLIMPFFIPFLYVSLMHDLAQ